MARKSQDGGTTPPKQYKPFHIPADIRPLQDSATAIISAQRREYERLKAGWVQRHKK
jgi:hypothetical protein